jgi:RimJ/RimL family protein N-acetyltransferase
VISTRRLHLPADREFFELIPQWREAYPRRYQAWDALDGPVCSYLKLAENPESICIGIEEDGEPVAVLVYHHTGAGWFEAHLEAKRGFDAEKAHPVAFTWGWWLFELGAQVLYAWILEPNRVSAVLTMQLGLRYDGTVRWRDVFRGKVLKSRRYTLTRETWLGWQNVKQENRRDKERRQVPEPGAAVPAGVPTG